MKTKNLITAIVWLIIALSIGVYVFLNVFSSKNDEKKLTIAMNIQATDLSAYALNLNNTTRTSNIYQGLVALDRNLRTVPALAVSWGVIDDTTWEFRIREGVKYHDGTQFKAIDIIDAFNKAKDSNDAQIEAYIKSIREMSLKNGRVIVSTFAPDPLLLSKLSKLLIFKEGTIGTGPYKLKKWTPGKSLELTVFRDYWGTIPEFESVSYVVQKNRVDRGNNFDAGKIDILAAVTEEQVARLPDSKIKTDYGLEVNFLMFKLDDPLFKEKEIRQAVQKLINPDKIEEIGNNFIRSATQFTAPGVFGYNKDIKGYEYTFEEEPRDLFGVRLRTAQLDYLSSYRTLSEYLSSQFKKAGINLNPVPSEPDELLKKIEKNESQLYLIGWRADDGDAGGFFDSFVHSKGAFNKGRYKNDELDRLIEEARREMEPQSRLAILKQIGMKLEKELIGIPLFETSRLYAVQEKIDWEPRLDGAILASEVHLKK